MISAVSPASSRSTWPATREPLLASSTDGVGTKLTIAQAIDRHDTVGLDLVGMVVDDLVVCGAEPLFMLDYVACGKVVPERMADIVGGIADGCQLAGCALIGGETAEHPGMLEEDEYDLAGTGVGVVEADRVLGSERVRAGDVIVAMASSGLHSNGYSLVRHALLRGARLRLDAEIDELGGVLGDVLLDPDPHLRQGLPRADRRGRRARVRARDRRRVRRQPEPGAAGGPRRRDRPGLLEAAADLRATSCSAAGSPLDEMERTFNQGVGMVAVLPREDADRACAMLTARHVPAWVVGDVVAGSDVRPGRRAPAS